MGKFVTNITKIFFVFVTFVVSSFLCDNVVFAEEPPETLKVASSSDIPGYISGLNFGTKTLIDGTECYCLDIHKNTAQNVTVKLYGERDAGFAYLIENGYPNKSITGDNKMDLYITQVAVWWYLDETTSSSNLNNNVRLNSKDPYNIRKYVEELVSGAKKAKKIGYNDPKISVKQNNNSLIIENNKKYYVSNAIKVTVTNADEYTVKLKGAPKDSFVASTDGKKKNNFSSSEKFVVYVPVSSVKNNSYNFKANITSTKTYNKVYEYRSSNKNIQEIIPAVLYPTTQKVTESVSFNIFKSKVVIANLDSDTNKNLAGSKLVIKDSAGNVVTSWIATGSSHIIENLPKATYTLEQVKSPAGYESATKKQTFKITNINRNINIKLYNHRSEKYIVKFIKLDSKTHKAISGAKIEIKDIKGNIIETFESTNRYHTIENLKTGSYTYKEIKAPVGYKIDNSEHKFEVSGNKDIVLKSYNTAKTKLVNIEAIDDNTKENLVGAVLIVRNSNNVEIAKFTTTTTAYTIENLENDTYYVSELEAPEGYVLNSKEVKFTISDKKTTAQVTIKNKQQISVDIPDTRSNTSIILYIIGGLILAGVAILVKSYEKK